MKTFKNLREKINKFSLEEKNNLSYSVKDMKSADYIKKELSGIVKAEFEVKKKGTQYVINVIPKTPQDEKIVKSFMSDAKIEMLKENFVLGLNKVKITEELFSFENLMGETIQVTSDMSERIVEIHDTLNRDNQEVFMEMLVYSKETFDQMINFCETYTTRTV